MKRMCRLFSGLTRSAVHSHTVDRIIRKTKSGSPIRLSDPENVKFVGVRLKYTVELSTENGLFALKLKEGGLGMTKKSTMQSLRLRDQDCQIGFLLSMIGVRGQKTPKLATHATMRKNTKNTKVLFVNHFTPKVPR